MVSKKSKSDLRIKKHSRLRNRLSGTTERPRLAVFRSNNHMYAHPSAANASTACISGSQASRLVVPGRPPGSTNML